MTNGLRNANQVVTRMQFCCLWKIYLCLLAPKCTQNHVVTYIKNYTRKIYALLIGWNQVHLSCNTSAKLKHEYKLHIACTLSKFRLPCFWEMPFSCILFLSNIVISHAISCKEALEKFSRLQIALVICYGLLKYLVFDKLTRFLTPISLEIMSVLICAVTYRLFRVIWG